MYFKKLSERPCGSRYSLIKTLQIVELESIK